MNLNEYQKQVAQFSKERNWDKQTSGIFNMLCNISEETGEVWNVIKWIDNDEDMRKVISQNQNELSDGIGDLLWCVIRLANLFGVDASKSLIDVLKEYEERFPIEKVKNKKSNPSLGGYDRKRN